MSPFLGKPSHNPELCLSKQLPPSYLKLINAIFFEFVLGGIPPILRMLLQRLRVTIQGIIQIPLSRGTKPVKLILLCHQVVPVLWIGFEGHNQFVDSNMINSQSFAWSWFVLNSYHGRMVLILALKQVNQFKHPMTHFQNVLVVFIKAKLQIIRNTYHFL